MHAECKMNLIVNCKPSAVVLSHCTLEEKRISQCANEFCQESRAFLQGVVELSYAQQIFKCFQTF